MWPGTSLLHMPRSLVLSSAFMAQTRGARYEAGTPHKAIASSSH